MTAALCDNAVLAEEVEAYQLVKPSVMFLYADASIENLQSLSYLFEWAPRTPLKLKPSCENSGIASEAGQVSNSTSCKDPVVTESALVDVDWLFRHLADENLVVLDASVPPVVPGFSYNSENKFTNRWRPPV